MKTGLLRNESNKKSPEEPSKAGEGCWLGPGRSEMKTAEHPCPAQS